MARGGERRVDSKRRRVGHVWLLRAVTVRRSIVIPAACCFLATGALIACGDDADDHDASGKEQATSTPFPVPTDREHEAQLRAEQDDRAMACMRELGYEVKPSAEDATGWEITKPGMDDEEFSEQLDGCYAAAGSVPDVPVTAAEAAGMYDLTLELVACLTARGAQVSEPPSRAQWVETFLSGAPPWTPYEQPGLHTEHSSECPEPVLSDLG